MLAATQGLVYTQNSIYVLKVFINFGFRVFYILTGKFKNYLHDDWLLNLKFSKSLAMSNFIVMVGFTST